VDQEFSPGTVVRWKHDGRLGHVLPPSPLGYRFVITWTYPDGRQEKEDAVEVKWLDEIGGGIVSRREIEVV
jgi:hypothetical protein